jgi:serine/threonine protein kinase/tetratricopeptide (TPR) repeat protein
MPHNYSPGEEPVPGSGYRLVQFLGRGGFGQVWKATAPGGTEAALKIIALGGKEGRKEFRALQLVKKIRHPNLVPFFAFWLKGEDGSILDDSLAGQEDLPSAMLLPTPMRKTMVAETQAGSVQAMELIIAMGLGDKSLFDRLEECRAQGLEGIPQDELLGYMDKSAEAIDFLNSPVHNLGSGPIAIQHCDIKPHNLMIVGGAAQVCDFGLARMMGTERATTAAATIAYAAPECLVEGKPSASTDQYSLAVTYFELKTGKLPYGDETLMAVMDAKRQGTLDFSALPANEAAVMRRATAPNPADRYLSAQTMVRELRRACTGETSLTQRRSRKPLRYLLAAAIVIAVAVFIWREYYPQQGVQPPIPPPLIDKTKDAEQKGDESKVARSEDVLPKPPIKVDLAEAAFRRAEDHAGKGETDAAIADYTEAIRLRADYGDALFGRGRSFLKAHKYDEAIADFEKLNPQRYNIRGELAEAYMARGTQLLSQKNYPDAVRDLEQARKNNSSDSRIPSRLGAAWFAQRKWDAAVEQYTAALQIEPNDTDYYNRGRAYRRLGKTKEAVADFTEAIRLNPRSAAAYYARGDARMDVEDLEGAVADSTQVIALCNSDADANYPVVNAYILRASAHLSAGHLDLADNDLGEALRVGTPEDRSSIHNLLETLASAYADEHKMPQAIEWMKKAVDAAPDETVKKKYQTELEKYKSTSPLPAGEG